MAVGGIANTPTSCRGIQKATIQSSRFCIKLSDGSRWSSPATLGFCVDHANVTQVQSLSQKSVVIVVYSCLFRILVPSNLGISHMLKVSEIFQSISDALRYLLSGGMAILMVALVHKESFKAFNSIGDTTNSTLLFITLIVSVSFVTYILHRALLFPINHFFVMHYVKETTFCTTIKQ